MTRFKVPAFLGSSFAFLGGFQTVANLDTGIFADMSYGEKLPYACGGVLIAGLLYLLLSLIIKVIGVRRVMRFLPPVVTGPIIICIGLSLAPSAISNASTNWPLALIALALVIISISGQRYVQDHPDPHGNHRILCGSTDHERCRYDMRRWERHLKLQRCG